jgi:chromosome segregation ATPase
VEVALILVSLAFLVTLGLLVTGRKAAAAVQAPAVDEGRVRQLEAELDRRRKELDEQRRQLGEARDELKQTKRKLFEQRESWKEERDLVKARSEVERSASVQLEVVRAELSQALAEVDRLKREAARPTRPRPVEPPPVAHPSASHPATTHAPVAQTPPPPAATEPEKPRRVIRELSDVDKERMERLEHEARRERQRAADLEKEIKRLKNKSETHSRVYVVTKGELDLMKDKFKALEKRMNRTLLENDRLKRAIRDLERKTGISAARTELTPEEVAASDRQVEEKASAEAARDAELRAKEVRTAEEEAARETDSEVAAADASHPPGTHRP